MNDDDDNDLYDLLLTFRVKIKKWRIDDQTDPNNQEWCLNFWDRNLEEWKTINKNDLNRPGEVGYIENVHTFTKDKGTIYYPKKGR